jgi:hypothetical protein
VEESRRCFISGELSAKLPCRPVLLSLSSSSLVIGSSRLLIIFPCSPSHSSSLSCTFLASRFSDFVIGTTDTSPKLKFPMPDQYDICHPGGVSIGKDETLTIPCSANDRYVVIQHLETRALSFCEVQVLGESKFILLFM